MNNPNISFYEGDEARVRVSPLDLYKLVGVQLNNAPDHLTAEYKERYHQIIGDDNWSQTDPTFPLQRHMQSLFDAGHGIVAKDGEDTVGIVARQYMPQYNGRDVVQMRRMVVDKDYRGQRIGTALRERIFARIREESPDAIILNETETPEVIHLSKRMGMKEITMEESYRLKGGRPEDYDRYLAWAKEDLKNYKFFKYDPREHQPSP